MRRFDRRLGRVGLFRVRMTLPQSLRELRRDGDLLKQEHVCADGAETAPLSRRHSSAYQISRKLFGHSVARAVALSVHIVKIGLVRDSRNFIGSVDITHRCNLECAHCYFTHQGYQSELTDQQWIDFFDRKEEEGFPFYQCSWVGGEPLLRRELIGRLRTRFLSNLVVTNGTIPLPDWPDVNFYVSVDGTKEHYVRMRGPADQYDRLKKNVFDHGNLNMRVGMVVTRQNHTCIERFLEEWKDAPLRSVIFEFYTPVVDRVDEAWPDWELRDAILDRLIRLKQRYGSFIENNEKILRLMKSHRAHLATRRCLYSKVAFCYGPDGKPKRPCMMGPGADCSRCGCVLPFHICMMNDKGLMFREIMRLVGGSF